MDIRWVVMNRTVESYTPNPDAAGTMQRNKRGQGIRAFVVRCRSKKELHASIRIANYSIDRKIKPLDEHDLPALVLYHVVAVHAVAPGVEVVRPFQALVALDGEDRLAH